VGNLSTVLSSPRAIEVNIAIMRRDPRSLGRVSTPEMTIAATGDGRGD